MNTHLVLVDDLPVADPSDAAKVWCSLRGGVAVDRARHLRNFRGVVEEGLSADDAVALADALSSRGVRAWSFPMAMVPRIPKPLVSSRLDPSDSEVLRAQVALTGPAQPVPWSKVVLVAPFHIPMTTHRPSTQSRERVGLGRAALAMGTGIGAGKVLSSIRSQAKGDPTVAAQASVRNRVTLEIWSLNPWTRIQGVQERLDYSVCGAQGMSARDNFALLLQQILRQCNPQVTGADLCRRWVAGEAIPDWFTVEDNNDAAKVGRWMVMRATARRMYDKT